MKTLTLISFSCFVIFYQPLFAQVEFQDLEWNAALKKAAKEKKYIMTDCYTDWCYWCKVMDKKTFTDTGVGKFAKEHFVALKIDMEKEFGLDLGRKYHVNSYPTYLFFTPKGELIYTVSGFQPPAIFLTSLKDAIDPAKQTHLKGYSSTIKLTYPDFYGAETPPSQAELEAYLDTQKNLFSESNWAVISRYSYLSEKYSQFLLDNRSKYRELFGKDAVNDLLSSKLWKVLDSAIIKKDEVLLQQYLDECSKYELNSDANTEQDIRLYFYQATDNYKKLMDALHEWVKSTGNDTAMTLNNYCWGFYMGCDDPQLVHEATVMMEKVADTHGFAEKDTYASLLFKDKQYEKAEAAAIQAIEAGKKEGADYSATKKLLGYIKVLNGKDIVYGNRSDCDYAIVIRSIYFPICPNADTIQRYDESGNLTDTVLYKDGLHYEIKYWSGFLESLVPLNVYFFSTRNVKGAGSLEGKLLITYHDNTTPYETTISAGAISDEAQKKILALSKDDVITFKNFYLNDGATVIPSEIKFTITQ